MYEQPYVVIWVDRCSEEYIRAFSSGTVQLPETWDGYPVMIQWTCGEELDP